MLLISSQYHYQYLILSEHETILHSKPAASHRRRRLRCWETCPHQLQIGHPHHLYLRTHRSHLCNKVIIKFTQLCHRTRHWILCSVIHGRRWYHFGPLLRLRHFFWNLLVHRIRETWAAQERRRRKSHCQGKSSPGQTKFIVIGLYDYDRNTYHYLTFPTKVAQYQSSIEAW